MGTLDLAKPSAGLGKTCVELSRAKPDKDVARCNLGTQLSGHSHDIAHNLGRDRPLTTRTHYP